MNYQHIYHAGNFADIIKHAFFVALLQHLQLKSKPFVVLDTHAGLGAYQLNRVEAQKSCEYAHGFSRLMASSPSHPALVWLQHYLREANLGAVTPVYPGSPFIAQRLLRAGDGLMLVEKHPPTFQALKMHLGRARDVALHERDAYEALGALLPPHPRRGLVLIDPPYEAKDEFDQLLDGLKLALGRFSEGVYLVWYPLKAASELHSFYQGVRALPCAEILRIEIRVLPESTSGLLGSGLMILNPPWQFEAQAWVLAEELALLLNQRAKLEYSCRLIKP